MTTIPRRDSLPVWPGPQGHHGPPPFQGAPPPMPAGYGFNQQQWSRGQWMPNPQWNPHQYPAHANTNAWMPGPQWRANPSYQPPTYPGGRPPPNAQQQANFNPYKRQVKPPSAEYLSQPISNNGLQLESLVEVPDRYGDAAQLSAPKTPWVWNPVTLSNDGESPSQPSRNNSGDDTSSIAESNSSLTTSDYASSSTERGQGQNQLLPSRHASEPVVHQHRPHTPPIVAPLARHATEPAVSESYTSRMELRPTFSPSVVVTQERYKSPRSTRNGSSASLHSAYSQGERGSSAGPVDALSEQLQRTRFDSFSSGSSGSGSGSGTSSGMFSSPATTSSFSSYGSGSGSFNGVSPSKSSHPTHGHGESRSIAGLPSLSDEPESYPDVPPFESEGLVEILSPIRIQPMLLPESGRRKPRQKHEPSPLRREATEPVMDPFQPPSSSLPTIPEQYGGYGEHRRRQSSRQCFEEPRDQYLGAGHRQGSNGRAITPPSPQETPRPQGEYGHSNERSNSYQQSHTRTPPRQGPATSYYDTPPRKSSTSRYSPPDSASRRPSSRQASLEPEGHHPLTPPEALSRGTTPPEQSSRLRPYNPLPEPPRFYENQQKTPPMSQPQYSYGEDFVLQAAPATRSGSQSSHIYLNSVEHSSNVYPTPQDGDHTRPIPPVTPKRSPPVSPTYPASATSPQVQQPTPRHTPLSFDPHAHLGLPISPRVLRTPVPVDQPSLPMPRYKHVPMPTPPHIAIVSRNVRVGYWNKRGDHFTSTGYAVFAPSDKQYPGDLKDYPDVGEGYKNDQGFVIDYEERPELINSTSRSGLPPLTPYQEFISYRVRQIPVTRSNEILS